MSGVVGGLAVNIFSDDQWVIIYVASLCDVIGFYSFFIVRDLAHFNQKFHHLAGLRKLTAVVVTTIKALSVEFGLSELADTLFIRPACIFFAGKFVDSLWLQFVLGIMFSDLWMMGICPLFYRIRIQLVEEKIQQRKVESN